MNMPLMGGDGWDSPELWKLGGAALKNAYISNHYSADNPAPEIQNFVKNYNVLFTSDLLHYEPWVRDTTTSR